jgi:hypothetical protein
LVLAAWSDIEKMVSRSRRTPARSQKVRERTISIRSRMRHSTRSKAPEVTMCSGWVQRLGHRDTARRGTGRHMRWTVCSTRYGVGPQVSRTSVAGSGARAPSTSGSMSRSAPRTTAVGRAAPSGSGGRLMPGTCSEPTRRTV